MALWLAPSHTVHEGVRLPPPHLRFCGLEFRDDAFFLASARSEADRLMAECGLTRSSRVLDVGCGPGRLAIGIIDRLGAVAEYQGLDVDRRSVRWGTRHITARHREFRFRHVDVRNSRYNPRGAVSATSSRLPFLDSHFDVASLYSVFSHMRQTEVRAYLGELRRVMRPGATLFFTGFVEENVPEESVNPPGYRQEWKGELHCVRYERNFLERMVRDAGFELLRFVYGEETDGQSAIYARRG